MQIPENGFYYHYKHDDAKGINDHAYEVVGLSKHSETDDLLIIYVPLYESTHLIPAQCYARPIELFFDEVEHNGATVPHFTKITEPGLIEKLEDIKMVLG